MPLTILMDCLSIRIQFSSERLLFVDKGLLLAGKRSLILGSESLLSLADSTDRRNTRIKSICRCLKAERLSRPLV